MNRLSKESSPYLLQHQNNPVDWYPWGEEALSKSRDEDKPVFLSVGYSACHWCHVMEHESFENQTIADYLNQHFVSVKVDREERPDLDQIYMQAVMAMNGHGGWPLSAFLTPDQDFFFGGTYWPPFATAQMPGFDRVLASVLDAYHNRRDQVVNQSKQITQMLNSSTADESDAQFHVGFFEQAAQKLHNLFDNTFGGFGSAPKFPHPMDLQLLLRLQAQQRKTPDENWNGPSPDEMQEAAEVTLTKMAYGGIFDHLAGGFARYSVDARWLVPHFEKMLYDNALLSSAYIRAYQASDSPFFARICQKTCDYLLTYMQDEQGPFYSTEDADSEGVEGKFYVWSVAEVVEILGQEIGQRFCELYDVTASGNFEGDNILNLPISFADFAKKHSLDKTELMTEMRQARSKLLQVRDKRVRPGLDDKVLTSWNGLAITAFAEAAIALNNENYGSAAERSAEFLWQNLRHAGGRLLHAWRNGEAKLAAYLDDYAYLINAFVTLYRVRFDRKWIDRANELQKLMVDLFHNSDNGAFYFTAKDHEQLIARTQEFQDSAVPSGNSMAATALIRLGRLTAQPSMVELGFAAIGGVVPLLKRAPNAASQSLLAAASYYFDAVTFVLLTGDDPDANDKAIELLQNALTLDSSLLVSPELDEGAQSNEPAADALALALAGKTAIDGQPTLYICRDSQCELPIIGVQKIETAVTALG